VATPEAKFGLPEPRRGLVAGLVAPLLALAVGFVAISQWQEQLEIERLAALDFAVLLDDGPLEAYADRGFGVLLQAERRSDR